MILDATKAATAIKSALLAAGYTVRGESTTLDVYEKTTFRGQVLVGRYVEFTRLATTKIQRLANGAAEGK